jgi:hypothetical protein
MAPLISECPVPTGGSSSRRVIKGTRASLYHNGKRGKSLFKLANLRIPSFETLHSLFSLFDNLSNTLG